MKKLVISLFMVLAIVSFTGCAKVVNTEYQTVKATIVNTKYTPSYTYPIMVGKVVTIHIHPAQYDVTVNYNNINYTFNNQNYYNKFKDSIGNSIECSMEIKTYDDGTVNKDLIEILDK